MESFDVLFAKSRNQWVHGPLQSEGWLRLKVLAPDAHALVQSLNEVVTPVFDINKALKAPHPLGVGNADRAVLIQPLSFWAHRDQRILATPSEMLSIREKRLRLDLEKSPRTYTYSDQDVAESWEAADQRVRAWELHARRRMQGHARDGEHLRDPHGRPKHLPLWRQELLESGQLDADYAELCAFAARVAAHTQTLVRQEQEKILEHARILRTRAQAVA